MTSKMLISTPSEKLSSDKCNSSTRFSDVTISKITLRAQKSKKESKKNRLAIVGEEADSQNDSFLFPNEESILLNKTNLNSGNTTKNKKSKKADDIGFKRLIENKGIEAQVEDYYSSKKEEQQMFENNDGGSRRKRKKHKKHKKHKNLDSCVELKYDTIVSSTHSKEKSEKTNQSIKHKNKTVGVILNTSDVEKTACKIDSPANTHTDGKPTKRKLFLSQSSVDHTTEYTISDESDTTYCSTKSLGKSNLHNSHKKFKRKFRPNSKEPENNFCNENNVDGCNFGEDELLTHFQNQESVEFSESRSYPGPKMENHVSLEMPNNWVSPKNKKVSKRNPSAPDSNQSPNTKYHENETQNSQVLLYNTSFMTHKKPKKRRLSSLNLGVNKLSTTSNENHNCDINQLNTSEVFDNTSTIIGKFNNDLDKYELSQNLPKSKRKHKILEMKDEFCSIKITTEKEKAEMKKSKKFKALNMSNSATLDAGQMQKDLITEALNNVSSKSVKKDELIHAEGGRINIKPNDKPSVVKINPSKHKQKLKRVKANILLSESSCRNSDKDKVQRDLLAAAFKSSSKSLKSHKINRSDNNFKERNYTKPNKETNKKGKKRMMSRVIHESAKESTSALQSKLVQSSNVPYQALSQSSTSLDVGSIGKVKSDKNPKAVKLKSKFNKDGNLDIEEMQQQLPAAPLKKVNSEPIECKKSANPELHQRSKIEPHESNSALQPQIVQSSNMPYQGLPQPSTSQNVGSIGKGKSDKNPKKVKLKSKLNEDGNFDIEKMQRQLLAAALMKVNSEPIESKKSVNPELHQGSKIEPHKSTKDRRPNSALQQKIVQSSNMPYQGLPQPSTSQNVGSIGKGKSDKTPKKVKLKSKLNEDGNLSFEKIQQQLPAASLNKINSEPIESEKSVNPELHYGSKIEPHEIARESNSALQPKIVQSSYMPYQALSQPSTSQNVRSIGKGKSDKTPKKVKLKSKLNEDGNFDIEKMQRQLLAAALKKVNSKPIDSKNSVNPELHQGSKIEPHKSTKERRPNSALQQKIVQSSNMPYQALSQPSTSQDVGSIGKGKSDKTPKKVKLKSKLNEDGNLSFEKIQQQLPAASLNKINSEPIESEKSVNPELHQRSKIEPHEIARESNSALQPQIVQSSNMPYQALSQPSTSENVGSIGKGKSDKTPKKVKLKSKLNEDGNFDIEKMQRQLLAAALKKVNSEPIESKKSVNPELHQCSKIEPHKGTKESRPNSALQPKMVQSSNMPYQALSQPSTSENKGSIGKGKSDKNPKAVKLKSKLNKDGNFDIEKMQQQLPAAAPKKVNSEPIESEKSVNPELHHGSKIEPHEIAKEEKQAKGNEIITKRVKKVKEGRKTVLKNKSKSVQDPFKDFTAKLLSAELEKRKKVI